MVNANSRRQARFARETPKYPVLDKFETFVLIQLQDVGSGRQTQIRMELKKSLVRTGNKENTLGSYAGLVTGRYLLRGQ